MATPQVTFGCNFNADGYWDAAEFARRAEALGFDRITTGEHLMDGNPPRPTVLSIPAMAAAAGATKRWGGVRPSFRPGGGNHLNQDPLRTVGAGSCP